MFRRSLFLTVSFLITANAALADESIWQKLRAGGQVIVMRHPATDGGPGDPPEKNLSDCSMQRNLSEEGREQAKEIGETLRERGVRVGKVMSAATCRTIDTAKLAFGKSEKWAYLNSVYSISQSEQEKRIKAVHQRIATFKGPGNLFLVTHADNIKSLFGFMPPAGGFLVLTPAGAKGFTLVGTLSPEMILAKPEAKDTAERKQ